MPAEGDFKTLTATKESQMASGPPLQSPKGKRHRRRESSNSSLLRLALAPDPGEEPDAGLVSLFGASPRGASTPHIHETWESDESFVRGLLAPPPDLLAMTESPASEPLTPLRLEPFPSSPLKTPVRGQSRDDSDL